MSVHEFLALLPADLVRHASLAAVGAPFLGAVLAMTVGARWGWGLVLPGAVTGLCCALIGAAHAHSFAANRAGTGFQDGPFEMMLAVLVAIAGLFVAIYRACAEIPERRADGAGPALFGLLLGGGGLVALADMPMILFAGMAIVELAGFGLSGIARPALSGATETGTGREPDQLLASGTWLALMAAGIALAPFSFGGEGNAGMIGAVLTAIGLAGIVWHRGVFPAGWGDPKAVGGLAIRGWISLVGAIALMRTLAGIAGSDHPASPIFCELFGIVALGVAAIASFRAVLSRDAEHVLSLFVCAEFALMVLALASGSRAGAEAAMLALAHGGALAIGGPFLLARLVDARGGYGFNTLAGTARNAPWAGASLVLIGASMAGAPLTLGFLVRWRMIDSAIEAGAFWAAAGIGVVAALLLAAVGRLIENISLSGPEPESGDGAAAGRAGGTSAAISGTAIWAEWAAGALALALLWAGLAGGVINPALTRMSALFAGGLSPVRTHVFPPPARPFRGLAGDDRVQAPRDDKGAS